jgi:hypothetical protein
LVEEIAVLNLEFVAFVIELELGFFHEFFVFVLDLLDLVGMFLFKDLDFILNFLVSFEFVVDFFFVVLFKFGDLLIISFFFKLKSLGEFVVLFGAVLNVGILDFFVGFKGDFVLLFESLHFLAVDDVQFLLLEFEFFLRSKNFKLEFFDGLVFLLYSVNSLQVKIIGTLCDSFTIFRLNQTVSLFFLFFYHATDTET